MNKPIIFRKKTIASGGVIEQFTYERGITHGFEMSEKWKEKRRIAKLVNKASQTKEQLEERRIRNRTLSMLRAKKTLTRLVDANVYQYHNTKGRPYPPVFLTLTFKEDIKDQKQANPLFSLFIKRLNYHVSKKISNPLRYSVVIEFQDLNRGGVVHYHVILYDLPLIKADTLEKIWREGTININAIKHVKKIGNYISKYMSKNFGDARLDGHKRYFSSRGLIKPTVYAGEVAYKAIRDAIPADTPMKERSFQSARKGLITTTIFTLRPQKGLKGVMSDEELKKIEPYDIS